MNSLNCPLNRFIVVSVCANVLLATPAIAASGPDLSRYQMVFNDEFNGTELDDTKWNTGFLWGPYLPINNEEQLYVDTLGLHQDFNHSPFEFTGSSLKIVATSVSDTLQPPTRPAEDDPIWDDFNEYRFNGPTDEGPGYQASDINYLSGLITSYDTFRFTHGYVESRVKLPVGQGLWPAFWANTSFYVEDVPEIDVMEFLGHQTDRVYHTYHYFEPQNDWRKISTPSYTTIGEDFTQEWHTFGLEWGPTEIIWYVDGEETRRVDVNEYDIANQAVYLLANLAVGGTWPGTPDVDTVFPAQMEIDYIRAYKRQPIDTITPALLASDFQMVFEDEFSGTSIDTNKWKSNYLWGPYLTINNEEQIYPDMLGSHDGYQHNPFSVANGKLSITATAVDESELPAPPGPNSQQFVDNPTWQRTPGYRDPESENFYVPNYVSGVLTTYDSLKFVHGYAEISAKLPAGSGLWPAFWLLNGYYVDQQPEIDVMEFRGENPNEIVHSYHYSTSQGLQSDSATTVGGDYTAAFHTYGVHWQPGKIDWYVDGAKTHTTTGEGVSSQVMYLLLNLAVGGNFVDEVDQFALPAEYQIDYVRVWQRMLPDQLIIAPESSPELDIVSSCLAGRGRIDLNIVNAGSDTGTYRMEMAGQTPRQTIVAPADWGRLPITGRPNGTYPVVIKRNGEIVVSTEITVNCGDSTSVVSIPEVSILNACRAGNGYILFQMVNPDSSPRPYVIQFEGVNNRSTTAAAFGQALRATTGRPDGTYQFSVRSGSTLVDAGSVTVDCD